MRLTYKRLLYALGLICLALFHVFIVAYVTVNIVDWKIAPLNPPENPTVRKMMDMTYPPQTGMGMYVDISERTIIFEWILQYTGTLAEGTPVNLSCWGTLSPSFMDEVKSVTLYFRGAVAYPTGHMQTSEGGVHLLPSTESPSHQFEVGLDGYLIGNTMTICWLTQGDYYPSIDITFTNYTTITQSYSDNNSYLIHVEGGDLLKQQASDRTNTAIAIGGALASFVDVPLLLGKYILKCKKEEN